MKSIICESSISEPEKVVFEFIIGVKKIDINSKKTIKMEKEIFRYLKIKSPR